MEENLTRRLFKAHELRFAIVMAEQSAIYEIANASIEGGQLTITRGDGHHSSYHPLWLRHQCECKACGAPIDGVRGIRLSDIPPKFEPELRDNSNTEIPIPWMLDKHRSVSSARWLRNHCYSDEELGAEDSSVEFSQGLVV